jgi:hypothetical protein
MPRNQENQQKGKINFRKPLSARETSWDARAITQAENPRKRRENGAFNPPETERCWSVE